MIRYILKEILFKIKKRDKSFSPVFIIGCGRSGTTILGKTLSKHVKIKYLNERRDLWHKPYPALDIWSENIRNSKLYLDEDDIIPEKNKLLHHLLFKEQVLSNADVLLEKLPINNFRLRFLKASFPNAKYIYLTRNGLEVSKSIARRIKKRNWFTGRKYLLMRNYALGNDISFDININSDLEKGMWEWKLSIDESDIFFKQEDKNNFIHLSYKDLVDSPSKSIRGILDFLGLSYTEASISNMSKDINRKTPELKETEEKNLHLIGKDILNQSISNDYTLS